MEFKAKHILVIAIIIILGLISFIVISIKTSQNIAIEETKEYEINENKIGFNSYEDTENLIMQIAIKDGNWSNLLLTDNFKSKYNEKDGVLGKIKFDRIEYKPYNEGKYPFEERTYFVITQGLKRTVYTFNLIGKNGYLDDIKIFEIFNLTDENGQELKAIVTINMSNFYRMFYMLSRGGDDEKAVAVTDNFHKKYPYFLDIFEHYSPLMFNHIEFIPDRSSWEKKEAYFTVDSELECKKREYLVKFTLDKNGYLDDVETMKIKEEQYAGSNKACSTKIKYINSNWDNLKITDDFKKKFSPNKGIIPDIDNINIDIPIDGVSLKGDTEYICCFRDKNNNQITYLIKYIDSDDNLLDDVICEKLPYTNKTANEVRELYLKEYTD